MRIIWFSIAILAFTIAESTLVGIFVCGFAIVFELLKWYIEWKKHLVKKLLTVGGLFLLAWGAVAFKQVNEITPHKSISPNLVWTEHSHPQWNSYIWTGIILQKYSEWRYVLADQKQCEYLLHSEKKYSIGQEIYFQWFFAPARTGMVALYQRDKQEEILSKLEQKLSESGALIYKFDYGKRLMMKWFAWNIYEKSSLPLTQHTTNFVEKLRIGLESLAISTYGESRSAGLVLGMLIWDKSHLSAEDYQSFVGSGLVHLIAVSGGNIVMIVVFLGMVLFFVPFYLRNGIILCVVVIYAMICWMDSSVMRATIMGVMSMLALFWWREIQIRRALSIAYVLMLLYNPYFLVYDVGFVLSFCAILGLVWMQGKGNSQAENKEKNIKISWFEKTKKYVYQNYFSPTIGASIGVFPVIMFFMGQMNLLGIIWNILVLPIVPFVMIYGFLSLFLYRVTGWGFVITIETKLVEYVFWVSSKLNEYGIFVSVEKWWMKYFVLGVFLGMLLWRRLGKSAKDKRTQTSKSDNIATDLKLVKTTHDSILLEVANMSKKI